MVQTRQMNQLAEVGLLFDNKRKELEKALPDHIAADRFIRVIKTALQNTPELLDCDRMSLWNAALRAASDGLLPDGHRGAIVIYRAGQGGAKKAQWLPMIAGIRQLVRNSGEITTWEAHVVHERDQWQYEQGDNPHILHRPVGGDRGPVIAAYSVARFKTGEISREWMWLDELEKVRKVSKAVRGPWADWTDEMYRKTVAKRHAKVLPMSSDLDDLLRRSDEPDDDEGGTPPPSEEPRRHLTSMTDALDMIEANTAKRSTARHRDGGPEYKPTAEIIDELDAETGEVIDQGEYAPSDDERPLEKEEVHRDART
jgi:recombination protein RecT